MDFEIGQKVKALKTLIQEADGDHPTLTYAEKGDDLIVRGLSRGDFTYHIPVSHEDVTDNSFLVADNEIA